MPRDNLGLFSLADIRLIRAQSSAGTLSVREWADVKGCGLETIRRIARRDTYREVADIPEAPQSSEPSEFDLAASLARLSAAAVALPPQRAEVNDLLDELRTKGRGHD